MEERICNETTENLKSDSGHILSWNERLSKIIEATKYLEWLTCLHTYFPETVVYISVWISARLSTRIKSIFVKNNS